MRPDETNKVQGGAKNTSSSQQAAARLVRAQIDNIYDYNVNSEAAQVIPQQQIEDINPYQRTHTINPLPQSDQWKKYHTAWQSYYQQYYEGYYTHHLQAAKQLLENQAPSTQSQPDSSSESVSKEEAMFDLRQKLLGKVQESATKVKKSRHFIPILSGLAVILVFLFLQFNRLVISNVMAYVSPGTIELQNIVIDPNINQTVSAEPKLIIPKINVDVPVSYDVGSDYDSQMAAMLNGLAHFAIPGARSHPGQIGNTVISGHSSNDLLDSGDYKFIFAQLDKLNVGDIIYLNYQSVRYSYSVTGKEVVKPSEINKLVYPTAKPILTLITCTPIGTSINRLLVTAEQVSPDPAKAAPAPDTAAPSTTDSTIPGNSPTLLERIFGKSS
ncbi:hypothetical protein CVV43_03375 [Candidatus Saccharibacteria bacterium HGW-Saccharibacteria-1]|jgi:sortase A|nr:MAG: hypothetical protein CVV43_03375 [Candidatus Saccharibacteria bacterium HGW-Saccharibacteria-1]